MLTPTRKNQLPPSTSHVADNGNTTHTYVNSHFIDYSPVRKISRNPSDESFEFLRRAPRKNRDDMPEDLKNLHKEVARSATSAKKLTFDDRESESTQSSSP